MRKKGPVILEIAVDDDKAGWLHATIECQRRELVKHRQRIADIGEGKSRISFLILFACAEDRTDADGDKGIPDQDVESQDEGDQGYGARPGGGFTSVVSILRSPTSF